MKTVYVGRKSCGCIVVALDFKAMDAKTIGKFLQLIGESNLVIDRVDQAEVIFFEECPHIQNRSGFQMPIEFHEQAEGEGDTGPSDMPEGFICTFSGPCPHENKSCAGCEYAGSAIPKDSVTSPAGHAPGAPEGVPQNGSEPDMIGFFKMHAVMPMSRFTLPANFQRESAAKATSSPITCGCCA